MENATLCASIIVQTTFAVGLGILAEAALTFIGLGVNPSTPTWGMALNGAIAVAYGIGVILALWGTLVDPFNALGWIAVGLNLLLGSGFAWSQLIQPRTASTSGT